MRRLQLNLSFFMIFTTVAVFSLSASAQPTPERGLWEPPVLRVAWPASELGEVVAAWPRLAGLKGRLGVEATVLLTPQGLVERVRAVSPEVRAGELALGRLELTLERRLKERGAASDIALTLTGEVAESMRADLKVPVQIEPAAGRLTFVPGELGGRAAITRFDLSALTRVWPALALEGHVDLSVDLGGAVDAPRIDASLFADGVRWRGEAVGVLAGRWTHGATLSTFDARWGAADAPIAAGHLALPVVLDLKAQDVRWLDDKPLDLWFVARGLTSETLRPLWRAPAEAPFTVDLIAEATGRLDDLKGGATLTGTLQDRDQGRLPLRGDLVLDPRRQRLALAVGDEVAALEVVTLIDLAALRRADAPLAPAPVQAGLRLQLPLPMLGPYLPRSLYDPRGMLKGNLDVTGTLGKPIFQGELTTAGASLTFTELNQRVHDVELKVVIEEDTARITQLTASSGLGRAMGRGELRLEVTPDGVDPQTTELGAAWRATTTLSLELRRFPFIHETFPNGTIDGSVELTGVARPGDALVQLRVGPTELRLTDARMPTAQAIPTNAAIRRIDWTGDAAASDSIFAGQGHLNVEVRLDEPLRVSGAGADMQLQGRMVVDRRDTIATVEGGFEALPGGTFQLFEHTFRARAGLFTLPGGDLGVEPVKLAALAQAGEVELFDPDQPTQALPLEPTLDFTARGLVVDTHVLVKVRGPFRRPELILVSSPPLPEYQILTLLITGRVDAVDDRNGDVRRQVAALVSRFHNPSLSQQLYDRLGVDKIGLGFGASVGSPILTIGKQISRQLYVESVYHHNAPPEENEKEGRAEYRLNPFWTVDTVYGDAANGRVGIFWQSSFGGELPEAPPEDWGMVDEGAPEGDAPAP